MTLAKGQEKPFRKSMNGYRCILSLQLLQAAHAAAEYINSNALQLQHHGRLQQHQNLAHLNFNSKWRWIKIELWRRETEIKSPISLFFFFLNKRKSMNERNGKNYWDWGKKSEERVKLLIRRVRKKNKKEE